MRAYSILLLILLGSSIGSMGQNVYNPYTILDAAVATYNNAYDIHSSPTIDQTLCPIALDKNTRSLSGGYTGEYMISLIDHYWTIFPPTSGFAKTFKVETVGFPFVMNCWDVGPGSCGYPVSPLTERKLYMPDDAYDPASYKWGGISNVRLNGNIGVNGNDVIGDGNDPDALVSTLFQNQNLCLTCNPRNLFPHTTTKHTVYLHCGTDPTDPVIDSFAFYYDNTRGRMRSYPFYKENVSVSGFSSAWDVVFRPMLIIQNDQTNFINPQYDETNNNSDWFLGGTLNYFPMSAINNSGCAGFLTPVQGDPFAELNAQGQTNHFRSSNALL